MNQDVAVYATARITENRVLGEGIEAQRGTKLGDRGMMSLPFLLFACGLAAGWTQRRTAAMGFWVAGVLILLVLFKMQATNTLNISL